MRFVTLTTDYGTKDYYASVVKAKLLDLETQQSFSLLDITHEIPAFEIQVAAYQINAWQAKAGFNAIHLIGVDSTVKRWIAAMDRGAFYVMPDNGIISLLNLSEQKQVYQFQDLLFPTSFDDITVFVSALDGILNQGGLTQSQDWMKTQNFVKSRWIEPYSQEDAENPERGTLTGEIIHFDNYGNGITNISLKHLPPKIDLNKITVTLEYNRKIVGIHKAYFEMTIETMAHHFALFNSQDILEIGIFRASSESGGVKELLGLEKGQTIKLTY